MKSIDSRKVEMRLVKFLVSIKAKLIELMQELYQIKTSTKLIPSFVNLNQRRDNKMLGIKSNFAKTTNQMKNLIK